MLEFIIMLAVYLKIELKRFICVLYCDNLFVVHEL